MHHACMNGLLAAELLTYAADIRLLFRRLPDAARVEVLAAHYAEDGRFDSGHVVRAVGEAVQLTCSAAAETDFQLVFRQRKLADETILVGIRLLPFAGDFLMMSPREEKLPSKNWNMSAKNANMMSFIGFPKVFSLLRIYNLMYRI